MSTILRRGMLMIKSPELYGPLIPIMTSNTTPNGVASADSARSGLDAYHAMNGSAWDYNPDCWVAIDGAFPHWLMYEFSIARKVDKVEFGRNDRYCPKQFKIQGSNDGVSFTDLTETLTTSSYNMLHEVPLTKNISTAWKMVRILCYSSHQGSTTNSSLAINYFQIMGWGGGISGGLKLPEGTTAYFPFTSDSRDVIGGNVGAALRGTPTITPGGVWGGNALYLDGASALTIPYSDSLNLTEKCTIEVWFFPIQSSDTYLDSIYGNPARSGSFTRGFSLSHVPRTKRVMLKYGNGSRELTGTPEYTIPSTSAWYHFSLNKDGTDFRLYANGTLVSSFTASVATSTVDFLIGKSRDTNNFWTGYMNDLLIVQGSVLRTENFTPPTEPYI